MRARTELLSHTERQATDNGAGAPARSRRSSRRQSVTQPHRSRIGLRAEQAARERAIALKVVSMLGILVVAAIGLSSAAGWATPLFRTLTHTSAGASGSQAANALIAAARRQAATGATSRGIGGGSSTAIAPVKVARKPFASAKLSSGASSRPPKKSIASAKAAVKRAVASRQSVAIHTIAPPPPPPPPPPSAPQVAAAAASAGSLAPRAGGTITIETFGYSFGGAPDGSKSVADVRNIDAGTFVQTENGLMPSVRARVMATATAQEWLRVMRTEWTPALKDGDKVSIGCSRGHHRSVTLGFLFAEDLRARGYSVNLVNRDIAKSY